MARRKTAVSTPETSILPAESTTQSGSNSPAAPTKPTENYTVLARRYRPQQFSALVGQEAVVQALINALESNRVAHAYLFTGARGVGKTSTARILAKALNCVKGPTPHPCDRCEICRSIASGEDVDVLEIDGASNNRIDEVREIRQNVQYRPSRARYKIYIIDEVHMLTTQAFNALLKTLEEPPEHVKFIFATTEVQKIPITILSRCQRFDFAGIGTARIVGRLREVVAQEGKEADDEALELIARRAGGSMRDAQSLLDQLLAFGGDRLTIEQVHQLLGTAHDERVLALAAAVLDHDAKRSLELLGEAADQGLQLGEFLDQLIDYWRDLLLAAVAGGDFPYLNIPSRFRQQLAQQATASSPDLLLAGLDILSTAKVRLRGSSHIRILLEMALVRLSRLEDLVPLSQLSKLFSQASAAGDKESVPASGGGSPGAGVRPTTLSSSLGQAASEGTSKKKLTPSAEIGSSKQSNGLTTDSLPRIWQEVIKQAGIFLANYLGKAGLPAISGPNTLVLRFPPDYNAAYEHCQQPGNLNRVEEIICKLVGSAWSVRVESNGRKVEESNEKSVDEPNVQSRYRQQRADALREPLIKRAVDVLGAQFIDVEPGFGETGSSQAEPAPESVEDGEEA